MRSLEIENNLSTRIKPKAIYYSLSEALIHENKVFALLPGHANCFMARVLGEVFALPQI